MPTDLCVISTESKRESNRQEKRTAVFPYLSDIFLSEKYSDMVIKCRGGTEYKAHRAIVCPQSPFFDAAMTGAIKVFPISRQLLLNWVPK